MISHLSSVIHDCPSEYNMICDSDQPPHPSTSREAPNFQQVYIAYLWRWDRMLQSLSFQ